MIQKVKNICKSNIILPLITLLCLAGFLGSLIFPNKVLDTYVMNMTEEEGDTEVLLPLSACENDSLMYQMDTGNLALKGIQVGICKNGGSFLNTTLRYDVYSEESAISGELAISGESAITETSANSKQLLSSNSYAISNGEDLQYVYLPFENYENCLGRISIHFYLEGEETENGVAPCLVANHKKMDNVSFYPGKNLENNLENNPENDLENPLMLKCSYIYTHNTYPFLYDFRILTFVFLAASMTVAFSLKKSKKE